MSALKRFEEVLNFTGQFQCDVNEMKFRRPRFVLQREDPDSMPIIHNPFRYITFFSPFTLTVMLGVIISVLLCQIYRKRAKRRETQQCQTFFADRLEHAGYLREKEIHRDELSIRPRAPRDLGSFGRIWRGTYKKSSEYRDVAVKVLKTSTTVTKVAEVRRLLRKQHPNIEDFIGILGKSGSEGNIGIVTLWHVRGSLYDHLRVNTLSYSQLLYLAESIANGLKFLHSEGVPQENGICKPAMAHRNIKSKNIILKDNKTACIADLDLVAVLDPEKESSDEKLRVGSIRYMSPEILQGTMSWKPKSLQAADIYAVAFVLWEMLSRTAVSEESSDYRMPLQEHVGTCPRLELMRYYIVTRHMRPLIEKGWRTDERFTPYISILEDCWYSDPRVRWSASRLHKRLYHLVNFMESIPNNRTILNG